MKSTLGISGRIAAYFQHSQLTPLLALVALLLGIFAVMVTPREEEPQINVTMAHVMVPFPGASTHDVEQMVTIPAEQVLSRMEGVEHVMSQSRTGLSLITVQFKVGVPRTEALVRLHDTVQSHSDWLPRQLGVMPALVKARGIDDVPIVSLTLHARGGQHSSLDLERIARSLEAELKRVPGTRDVRSIGTPGRALLVEVDPARLAASGVTVPEIRRVLQSANMGLPVGDLLAGERTVAIEAGSHLATLQDLEELVISSQGGKPTFLKDVARLHEGSPPATRLVWHAERRVDAAHAAQGDGSAVQADHWQESDAITLAITKKAGENAIAVADALQARVDELRNTLLPADVDLKVTRNYGATANDKAQKLIQKLLFATASVVALVFLALGRREAAIVGTAVILTLTVTLFASWAWGFTLNRVSLFALIFSIGILVDDAIVVVENIHRHQTLHPEKTLAQLIPGAVDEVGGPTILATLTVIAALLPMAFVSGLMGPYMSPIPINASMGMLLSLAIAFVLTPWLARLWMKHVPGSRHDTPSGEPSALGHPAEHGLSARLRPLFSRIFLPLMDEQQGSRRRGLLGLGVLGLIVLSLALPATGLVMLKMLPFDNKSELQIMVDLPAGSPVERTAAVLRDLSQHLGTVPEVQDVQAYAGTSAPISFNGLVRQYELRQSPELGDLQVNLVDKHHRKLQSHAIATQLRPALQAIAARHGAKLKVVEVPPGPPVMAPIVAEIYGPEQAGRAELAARVKQVFSQHEGVVDVDDSGIASAPRHVLLVDRRKAALLGISQQDVVGTLQSLLSGDAASYLHDGSKVPTPALIQLAPELHGELDSLLQLQVKSSQGKSVPLRELVQVSEQSREQPRYRKDLLAVHYVVADMAGRIDSPLYGMFAMRKDILALPTANGAPLQEHFISQPGDPYRHYAIKWDGEWQITYETFRDMGLAYGVGLVLIYLLVVAQFGSYLTPLIIMAPIPLTIVGVMPGHALLGAQFTATSMIGMIALAGIIVRNSILLVDFIRLQVREGMDFKAAVLNSAITRAQPIVLTALAAMMGAFFILDDPIFNGLAISLIFGILVSTLLTLVLIPLLYFVAYRHRLAALLAPPSDTEAAH